MLRSLYGKLAAILLLMFAAIVAAIALLLRSMLPDMTFHDLVMQLVIGGAAFALLTALLLFRLVTYRLKALQETVQAYRTAGFRSPFRAPHANPRGDEIHRLSFEFNQMAARMNEQLARLSSADAQRRELLANVSHDLRTPLAAMQGYLETLLVLEDSLSAAERRSYLEVAHKHCERLVRLVANLFELTKLDAHEIVPRMEPLSLAELAQDVAQKYDLTARDKGVTLAANVGDGVPMVNGDIGLIEHVLQNLIENALRHTQPGGSVRVSVFASDRGAAASVADTGAGIAPEDLPHIFDRFYRAGAEHTESAAGAGLGLAIVKRILDLHGTSVRVDSELARGTTFLFELPRAAPNQL